jgi:chloramphenicol 3-O phosphotransferase
MRGHRGKTCVEGHGGASSIRDVIVILNGTSSSGKSTLAKALQDRLARPFLAMGIDTLVFGLPHRYLNKPDLWAHVFHYDYVAERVERITPGPLGHQLVRGMHSAVAALAHEGLDVVVDHVLLDADWAADLNARLAPFHVLRVGVTCPVAVLEDREASRRDRTLGQARAQSALVHTFMAYDVVVDTSRATPAECAEIIASHV